MGWDPIAVIEGGVIAYVCADHIGRPAFATNSAGVKVWTANYLPFGGVRTSTGTPIIARFPGQWFQTENGLHQNWMRDYDPTTGRYLQADPLGLIDGASVYGYVKGNPGRWIDPRGEQTADAVNPFGKALMNGARHVGKVCAMALTDMAAGATAGAAAAMAGAGAILMATAGPAGGLGDTCDEGCGGPPPPPCAMEVPIRDLISIRQKHAIKVLDGDFIHELKDSDGGLDLYYQSVTRCLYTGPAKNARLTAGGGAMGTWTGSYFP